MQIFKLNDQIQYNAVNYTLHDILQSSFFNFDFNFPILLILLMGESIIVTLFRVLLNKIFFVP